MSNFIQQCQLREGTTAEIDDFIDAWHENPQGKSLHEFLGMTRQEYSLWLADASILPVIVRAHSQNRCIDEMLKEFAEQVPMASQYDDPLIRRELIDWLKKTQR